MIFAPFAYRQQVTSGGVDPDAQAFITAAGITDPTEQSAINQLVLDLKSYSVWSKMDVIYPFVGGTSTTTRYNLKDPSAYLITWNGGVTFNSNGVTGNASTGYGQTGWNPSVYSTTVRDLRSSVSFSIYSRTNSTSNASDIGVTNYTNAGGSQAAIQVLCRRSNGDMYWDNYSSSNGRIQTAVSDSLGLISTSRTSTTSMKVYQNSTQKGSTLTTAATTADIHTDLNYEMYVLAANQRGTAVDYTSRNLAYMHIGQGFSDTEISNIYTSVQTYQTTLGRQV
jgi:hypothetical protein